MAEMAGLAMGALSLTTLTTTVIECVDYLNSYLEYARDYELGNTKLLLLKTRLMVWVAQVDESRLYHQPTMFRHAGDPINQVLISTMQHINCLFETSQQLARRYQGKLTTVAHPDMMLLSTPGLFHGQPNFQRVLNATVTMRQKRTPWWKKIMWAIHDRRRLETTITHIEFLVVHLEDLFKTLSAVASHEHPPFAPGRDVYNANLSSLTPSVQSTRLAMQAHEISAALIPARAPSLIRIV